VRPVTIIEQSLSGLAGNAETLFRRGSVRAGRELAGVDVRGPAGLYMPESKSSESRRPLRSPVAAFDLASILQPKTFVYIFALTLLSLVQINDTLAIKELSRQNERLRERLRISTSISTAQELKASELQSIHKISGSAKSLGLSLSVAPPVYIEH